MRGPLAFLLVLAAACGITGPVRDVITLDIALNRVPCTGVAPMECLLMRERPGADWTYFYDYIAGFDFEPGYRYVLRVERREVANPPADGSSIAYRLVRVVSREIAPQG